jgi:hypothetical protein
MLERYKLRLRDGTVLVVDHDALSSWLVDGKALVQPVGSDRWFPLRQFLAKEKAEAAAAARRNPPPLPAPVAPPPLENGTGLRLAEPPPLPPFNEPSASASPPPVPTVDAPVWTSQPPILTSAPPLPASEPPALAVPPPIAISEPPAVRAPTEEAAGPARLTTPGDEVSIAAPPSDIEPEAPRFADVPAPADPPAPLLSVSEPPEVWAPEPAVAEAQDPPEAWAPDPPEASAPEPPEVWAPDPPEVSAPEPLEVWAPTEEAAALYQATTQLPAFDDEVAVAALPSTDEPEPPLFTDAALPSQAPEPMPSTTESPDVWAPTEEAAALYEATAELYESTPRPPARADEDALFLTASQAMNERPERPPSFHPRSLQVLADATPTSRASSKAPSMTGDGIIPLKPLDDEDEALRRGAATSTFHEDDFEAESDTRPQSTFLGLEPPWDARVNRWLDVLSRGVARLGQVLERVTPSDPASSAKAFFGRMRVVTSSWTDGSSAWLERHMRRDRPGLSQPATTEAPALSQPATAEAFRPSPAATVPLKPALMPPPPISELPVIRLAKIADVGVDQVDHDIYEGAGSLDGVWLWLKRIVLMAGLLVAGLVAAQTWETWLPPATQMARALFLEIHEREHPPTSKVEEPRPVRELLPAIAEELPHLTPETVALVLSRSFDGVLDPPEVFARAYDATERGLTALSASEAQELGALQRALLNALLPAERQRLREYDLVRSRRAPLQTEDRDAMRSFAHGARALPSWALERLQTLSGKAIAAALALPPGASPEAAAAP